MKYNERDSKYKFSNTTMKENETIIEFNQEKIRRYNEALKNRFFLLDKEYKDANGIEADWSHFEFILATEGHKFHNAPNDLILLKIFWGILWKYLGPTLKSYEKLSEGYDLLEKEIELSLRDYTKVKMELDIYREWVEKHTPKQKQQVFKAFKKQIERRVKEKIEAMKNSEEFKKFEEARIRRDMKKEAEKGN